MSKNKITVLLVEDEQTLAMIIKDTLEENDFIIHTANDGEEGLSLFFELHPDTLMRVTPAILRAKSNTYVVSLSFFHVFTGIVSTARIGCTC